MFERQHTGYMDTYIKWKVESNFTQLIDETGKIIYKEYPKPEKIPELMDQWFTLFNTIQNEEPLMEYCKLHITFGTIHPFADGNGRVARLVSNIPIIKAGLVPVTISKESRKEYITLLQNSKMDDDLNIIEGFYEFVKFAEMQWKVSIDLYQQAVNKEKEVK